MTCASIPPSRRSRASRGFTLLEVMVVVTILAVIAAMTIPRVMGGGRRHFDHAVEQVADLLVMYAQRDDLERRPVGLVYDPDRGWLQLWMLGAENAGPDEPAEWQPDLLVAPVKLPDIVDRASIAVLADGEPVNVTTWPLTHAPGEDRPTIEISMRSHEGDQATLRLTPHDVVPRRLGTTRRGEREPVDLDAEGRSRESW